MKLTRIDEVTLTLSLTENQLAILLACLRESQASIDSREYLLRIGAPIKEVSDLGNELMVLMKSEDVEL